MQYRRATRKCNKKDMCIMTFIKKTQRNRKNMEKGGKQYADRWKWTDDNQRGKCPVF